MSIATIKSRASYQDAVLATEPLAYWPMNGQDPLREATGNAGSITLYNSPATGQPGAIAGSEDQAVGFDGTNQYGEASVTGIAAVSELSVAFWMRLRSFTEENASPISYGSDFNNYWAFLLKSDPAFLPIMEESGVGDPPPKVNITMDSWEHWAFSFKASSHFQIYKNGALASEETSSVASSTPDQGNIISVAKLAFKSFYMDMLLDGVAIWDRSLPAAEIAALYESGIHGVSGVA